MNYYRRYIGDYHSKTMRLTATDHGVYGLMLDYYYAEEKPLPLDMDDIHALCRAVRPEDRKAVAKVLAAYFDRRGDGYHNERADKEIATSQQARINGKGHTGSGGDDGTGTVTGPPTGTVTGKATGKGGGSGHPPTTNHQPSAVNRQPPAATPQPPNVNPVLAAPKNGASTPGKTVETWAAYCGAYSERYGAEPTRNAKVNGVLAKFLDRVPASEAPAIAAFYVGHNGQFYVRKMHCVDLLLADAEKLRTEWATGRRMTASEAKNAEQGDALRQQADRVGKLLEVHDETP